MNKRNDTLKLLLIFTAVLILVTARALGEDLILRHPAEANTIYHFSLDIDGSLQLKISFFDLRSRLENVLYFNQVQGLIIPENFIFSKVKADGSHPGAEVVTHSHFELPMDYFITSSHYVGIINGDRVSFFFDSGKIFHAPKPKGGVIEKIWFIPTSYQGEQWGLMSVQYLDEKNNGLWLSRIDGSESFKILDSSVKLGDQVINIKNHILEIPDLTPIPLKFAIEEKQDNLDLQKEQSINKWNLDKVKIFLDSQPAPIAVSDLRWQLRNQRSLFFESSTPAEQIQILTQLLVYELTANYNIPQMNNRDPYVYLSILKSEAIPENHDFRLYGIAAIEHSLDHLKFSEADLRTKESIFLKVLKLFGNQYEKSTKAYDYLFDHGKFLQCSQLLLF